MVRGSTRAAGQGRGLGLSSSDTVVKATDLCSSAVLWGPDFEGWQSSKTLTKNIKNQFGSESYFDAVLVYFNNNQGDGVIIIVRPHEMCDMRKEEFYKIANFSLVLAPYAYKLFEYRKGFGT
ncbi:hypothetical protein BY996DRAFT_6416241 [Phakopsora pachyrhizi]|nr:hypothetical protein BY996DRAFT_6416241 [Phakopsora pachyrhizi]